RQVRVVFSNAYGSKPLVIGAASLARSRGGAVDARTIRPLSFGGKPGIVVPVGAPAVSDPVDLEVAAFGELSVSLFLPRETAAETYHRALPAVDALQPAAAPEAVLSAAGNFTLQAELPGAAP